MIPQKTANVRIKSKTQNILLFNESYSQPNKLGIRLAKDLKELLHTNGIESLRTQTDNLLNLDEIVSKDEPFFLFNGDLCEFFRSAYYRNTSKILVNYTYTIDLDLQFIIVTNEDSHKSDKDLEAFHFDELDLCIECWNARRQKDPELPIFNPIRF
jgi:hypothetical protein